jgi:hypothetical protein
MTLFSDEFEETVRRALEKEIHRLSLANSQADFASREFCERFDHCIQKELDQMTPFFCYKSTDDTLKLYLSPPDSEVVRKIDLEDVLSIEFSESDPEHLVFILDRLSTMVDQIKNRLKEEDL